ncbi:MAG: winged helix-turn-helix transcriptional regulator [Candidatus Methanomethylophilaceae archaeon]|nr:winged helix-turn-helix transcriptional regulator [Candidatus Methanomethylophilaceae archaeon]
MPVNWMGSLKDSTKRDIYETIQRIGPCTVSEIAEQLGLSSTEVTSRMLYLANHGYVTRASRNKRAIVWEAVER